MNHLSALSASSSPGLLGLGVKTAAYPARLAPELVGKLDTRLVPAALVSISSSASVSTATASNPFQGFAGQAGVCSAGFK